MEAAVAPWWYISNESCWSDMKLLILFVILAVGQAVPSLPSLEVRGFSWAENLVFDGMGNMFVSDATTGDISRIHLCPNAREDTGRFLLLLVSCCLPTYLLTT